MNLREAREAIDTLVSDADASRVYSEPYETADGTTVIPVAKVRNQRAKPVGVFVIKDGKVTWRPAVDGERVAMLGILVGLVSATLAGIAMVRRPPWPDLRGEISPMR
jgi:hypothetical protein